MHAAISAPSFMQRRVFVAILCVLGAVLALGTTMAAGASADPLSFASFSSGPLNADGTPSTQAGAHPFELNTAFAFNTVPDSRTGTDLPAQALKTSTFSLPAGMLGDPSAIPRCRQEDMNVPLGNCPATTQVGTADVDTAFFGRQIRTVPVYNMEPPPGEPAQFAFVVIAAVAHIDIGVRTDGDYGVNATVRNANGTSPIWGVRLHLWGVPADPSHDKERYLPTAGCPGADQNCDPSTVIPLPAQTPRKPFIRNPTSCATPLTTLASANSWQLPDQIATASSTSSAMTGCERIPFAPTISAAPDSRRAGAAAGFAIDIDVPQNRNPDGLASADVNTVVMRLPAGVALNPSAADGLQGCRDSDFALTSSSGDQCPDGSKIGTVQITSPLVDDPLKGTVFLASPLDQGPAAAAAGTMFRLFLEAQGDGVTLKLGGSIVPDPVTGQLTATFANNPQLPFTNLHLVLDGGSRAPLASPKTCGTYATSAAITPWSTPTHAVESSSSFTVDQGCDQAGKFQPVLDAGLTSPVAGGSSPFTLTLSRPDGQQDIGTMAFVLPPGLLARLSSVALCADPNAASGTCPSASLVGHTTVASGAGSNPVYIPQAGKPATGVYLAGPYKGAPYSLSIVVPAQAGPFDLGTVVVRAALFVDPVDAHVTVVSDPLPTIRDGVPLNIQKVNVTIDRQGFMVNPTSCAPAAITGTVTSSLGAAANVGNPFQVGNCGALDFKPKIAIALSGKGQTTDGKHPALSANVTMPSGHANLKKVAVTLPLSLALDPDNSQSDDLCEFAVGRQTVPACPSSSIVGTATAVTPLLGQPLSGPVYFVKNVRTDPRSGRQIRTLPTLAIPLRGGGITLVLRASSEVVDDHLVATFDKIPDAPVSSFKLNINGGKKDILVVSGTDICKSTQVAQQNATAQNGKMADAAITLSTPCALGVVAASHSSTALKLTVGGIGPGRVSVSGAGLVKAFRTITAATTATLTPRFSSSVRRKLAQGHNVRVRITVSFTPKGSKRARSYHRTLTVHGARH
jgi:hypothetical protein